MNYRLLSLAAVLTPALAYSSPAGSEEHKAPAAHAPVAAASATAAPTPAPPAVAPAAKPAAVQSAAEKAKPEALPPSRPRAKPAPVRLALATKPTTAAEVSAAAHAAVSTHSLHWSYEGETGPHAWSKLSPEYAKCGTGERQSPIDIRDGMKLDLEPITFEYRPSRFKVIDNGHTIQANVAGWNSMQVMGRRFKLVQFHFHTPPEEAINGRQYDMVVHLVHKDTQDRLAVVAVLVEGGVRQPAIQAVLNNLPLERNVEVAGSADLDLAQILPTDRRYFTYMGSLTTPPCSEDVLWVVMKQPVQATSDQINLFSRLYPMNARPIQASAGRTIKESN